MDSVRSRRLQSLSRWASGQAGSRRLEIKGNPHQGSVTRVSKVPDQRWGLGRISGQIPGQAAADEEWLTMSMKLYSWKNVLSTLVAGPFSSHGGYGVKKQHRHMTEVRGFPLRCSLNCISNPQKVLCPSETSIHDFISFVLILIFDVFPLSAQLFSTCKFILLFSVSVHLEWKLT